MNIIHMNIIHNAERRIGVKIKDFSRLRTKANANYIRNAGKGINMITKYRFGNPIETEAVVENIPVSSGLPGFGDISLENEGFSFTLSLQPQDVIYGLGEANQGINKRGYRYVSYCTDDPNHTEEKVSLYGAHNFLMVIGSQSFGIFFDYPSELFFDIGYTKPDILAVSAKEQNLDVYLIEGENAVDIVKQFRHIIGTSYIPPLWAFGYQQSRWGYINEDDIRQVVDGYRSNHLPLDAVYMDIDYMESYKDFTINKDRFPNFPEFVNEMKDKQIHLVPIIDAGVKIEPGYPVYEEGVKGEYFCKREDGSNFVAGVWPGKTHFPDMLNKDARKWFGSQYKFLIDQGIDGFWNDMNEPAVFYSEEGLEQAFERVKEQIKQGSNPDVERFWTLRDAFNVSNDRADHMRFYHNMDGRKVRHDKVHNLFGYNMTRAAAEGFDTICPDRRILLFSRSSYIGMHRYGGIWTGDNHSWWSHLLLNIQMMPSLNMCGFLYSGADLGGFGSNTTRELLLRWLAFGIFTPLMRNHAALGTREQECYQFEGLEDFRGILSLRYRLIPYIYSEFIKAALHDGMLFQPLGFVWQKDVRAVETEDQLLLGESLMIAPVYRPNVSGRYVYLPEDMLFVLFKAGEVHSVVPMTAGTHYINCALDEVPVFIRKGHILPLAAPCESTKELKFSDFEILGEEGAGLTYSLYYDDGITKKPETQGKYIVLQKE